MVDKTNDIEELERLCLEARKWIIKMISAAGTGHVGGSLSCVEILVTLYFRRMRVDPVDPCWPERDQLLLEFTDSEADQREQYEDDRKYMTRRLEDIDEEIAREPAQIEALYEVVLRRLEPVGLVYLWPETRA